MGGLLQHAASHQSLGDVTPESRFNAGDDKPHRELTKRSERNGEQWVTRKVANNGVVCDVLVTDGLLQFWVGNELLKTVARTSNGEIRKKHAEGTAPRR